MRPAGETGAGSSYRVVRVASLAQLDDAARIRWAVFAEAMALPPGLLPARREINGYDVLETTDNLVCYHGGEAVGTLRLMRPNRRLAETHGVALGLPVAIQYRIEDPPEAAEIAEVGRAAILPAHRGGSAIGQLYRTAYEASRRAGISHWIGMGFTETDSRGDALIMSACLRRQGRTAQAPRFLERTPVDPAYRPRRAFYAPGERHCASDGGHEPPAPAANGAISARDGLHLRREPVFEPAFKEYMLPVVLPLDAFAASPLGRRFIAA